jgi:hypothetical protein
MPELTKKYFFWFKGNLLGKRKTELPFSFPSLQIVRYTKQIYFDLRFRAASDFFFLLTLGFS